MKVKDAFKEIEEIKKLKESFSKIITCTEDMDDWDLLNDIDMKLSDYSHFLKNAIDNTEVSF